MGDTISVQTLVDNVRLRADKKNSRHVLDPEIVSYLNAAWRELYDVLVNTNEDYYSESHAFSTVGGTKAYALPSDFYKLRGVDRITGGVPAKVRRFAMQERNRGSRAAGDDFAYQIRGAEIIFQPAPAAAVSIELWYVPRAPRLTTDASPAVGYVNEIDVVNGYDEFLEIKAAIQVGIKEERDVSGWVLQAKDALARIVAASSVRDAAEPLRVIDVNFRGDDDEWS